MKSISAYLFVQQRLPVHVCVHTRARVGNAASPPLGWALATIQFDERRSRLAANNYGVKVNDLGSNPDCDNCPKTYSNQATPVNGC